ncbi:hypothetical protein CEXT_262721 [Caerostris extrusa]|uniref:Uncharacterized protein n=1 Tax=Caerostris extrusa TaxID=172846 RepID=A0AAV4WBS2_CAEEX|nr:hypothetical protein CEXT_262721 [Caerostris extrusa]
MLIFPPPNQPNGHSSPSRSSEQTSCLLTPPSLVASGAKHPAATFSGVTVDCLHNSGVTSSSLYPPLYSIDLSTFMAFLTQPQPAAVLKPWIFNVPASFRTPCWFGETIFVLVVLDILDYFFKLERYLVVLYPLIVLIYHDL